MNAKTPPKVGADEHRPVVDDDEDLCADGFVNVKDAAALLGIGSRTTVYEMINDGTLPAVKVRSRTVIPRRAITRFMVACVKKARGA